MSRFSVLTVALLVLAALRAAPAFAFQPLDAEAVFSLPGLAHGTSTAIEDKLVSLVDLAASGSDIRVAIYTFNRPAVARALLRASSRGVDVRVVLDGSDLPLSRIPGDGVQLLTQGEAGSGTLQCTQKPCLKFCEGPLFGLRIHGQLFGGSCHGLIINHNKFVLFSHLTTGESNIVAQMSANLDDEQMHRYNDLVIVKNDATLFSGMLQYWNSLMDGGFRLTTIHSVRGDSPVIANFFPRLVSGTDPVLNLLGRVRCVPGSTIRITGPNFTRRDVALRLHELSEQGCDVKIIACYEVAMWSPGKAVMSEVSDETLVLPYKGKTPAEQATNAVHSKIVLIDAAFDAASEKTAVVMTGSHNLDFFSLRTNDEVLLTIANRDLYNQYLNYWNSIDEQAHAIGVYAPNEAPTKQPALPSQ